uniref:Uncharacterized protein n=1 Tax=Anguilla anguilla TaxID=7936 RepID=A0A0E9QU17_ANGAN
MVSLGHRKIVSLGYKCRPIHAKLLANVNTTVLLNTYYAVYEFKT